MAGPLGRLYGNDETEVENTITEVMFRTRCCIPAIVQSYNQANNTAEVQPSIRERIINSNGTIEYLNLPLLVNVPVVFPSTNNIQIKFPISKGDECLVLFSDLSIDNFWEKGTIQNPVECRRHDLSDGIAIPCSLSVPKSMLNRTVKINFTNSDIQFTCSSGTISLSEIISLNNRFANHHHTDSEGGSTSGPIY